MPPGVTLEQDGVLFPLEDEALVGRARHAHLRIDDPSVHRFHAALLSDEGAWELRALAETPLRVADPLPRDVHRCRVVVDQVWILGPRAFRVHTVVHPAGADEGTRRSGIVWTVGEASVRLHRGDTDISLGGNAARLARVLLERRDDWVPEDEVLARLWPRDLGYDDRRTRANNLNVALSDLKRRLDSGGMADLVETRSGEPAALGRGPRTHLRVLFDPRVDRLVVA